MTSKGDRWGRDRLGRSEPAFLRASTTALPHPPARREADVVCSCCCVAARPANCGPFVCCEACAGRRVRRLCLPAVPCSAGFLFACCPLPAMPTALLNSLPRSSCLPRPFILLLFATCSCPCAPGSSSPNTNSLQAARLSRWQLQHGPAVAARAPGPFDCFSFSCRVHDPGPWVSVKFIRLRCLCKYECAPPACLCLRPAIVVKSSA